jgi:hypothetical protein
LRRLLRDLAHPIATSGLVLHEDHGLFFRTPSGIRVLTRIFIFMCPFIMGPYYALLATQTNLAFAIVTSVLTTLGMHGASIHRLL